LNERRLAFVALLLVVAACGTPRPARDGAASLQGSIAIRESVTLPSDARVEIQILDVTDADAEPRLVAEKLMNAPPRLPFAFAVGYDPATIDANRTYALRVRIRVGEELWFASPFDLRVLTGGNPTQPSVQLDRISEAPAPAKGAPRVADPDPPHLDARVRPFREEARSIDARLDRLDMREIGEGRAKLRLWSDDDEPVKLEVADAGPVLRPTSYYFEGGQLFWMRAPNAGYGFQNGLLVVRTDGKLVPQAELGSADGVLRDVASRLALFGL
jgi:putative lipoprotein